VLGALLVLLRLSFNQDSFKNVLEAMDLPPAIPAEMNKLVDVHYPKQPIIDGQTDRGFKYEEPKLNAVRNLRKTVILNFSMKLASRFCCLLNELVAGAFACKRPWDADEPHKPVLHMISDEIGSEP